MYPKSHNMFPTLNSMSNWTALKTQLRRELPLAYSFLCIALANQPNKIIRQLSSSKPLRPFIGNSSVPNRTPRRPNCSIVTNAVAGKAGDVAILNLSCNVARSSLMLNHDLYSSYGLWPEPADVSASVRLASFYRISEAA